jgi:hypothetical protein
MTPCTAFAGLPLAFSDLSQEIDPADVAFPQSSAPKKGIFGARKQWKGKKQ